MMLDLDTASIGQASLGIIGNRSVLTSGAAALSRYIDSCGLLGAGNRYTQLCRLAIVGLASPRTNTTSKQLFSCVHHAQCRCLAEMGQTHSGGGGGPPA